MEITHVITIGEMFDIDKGSAVPKQTIEISNDQLAIIEMFASTRKDEDLNTVYKLNDIEFRVFPYFNFS